MSELIPLEFWCQQTGQLVNWGLASQSYHGYKQGSLLSVSIRFRNSGVLFSAFILPNIDYFWYVCFYGMQKYGFRWGFVREMVHNTVLSYPWPQIQFLGFFSFTWDQNIRKRLRSHHLYKKIIRIFLYLLMPKLLAIFRQLLLNTENIELPRVVQRWSKVMQIWTSRKTRVHAYAIQQDNSGTSWELLLSFEACAIVREIDIKETKVEPMQFLLP